MMPPSLLKIPDTLSPIMRFLTLLLLAAPAAFAESPCGVDRRAIRCTKYPGADPEDPLREVYLAESTNATISICESIGQAACSCTQDGRMYCGLRSEARADNRLKFAAECRHDGDRSWKYEENQGEYAHMTAKDWGLDPALWPNVSYMAAKVKELTGAEIMASLW